MISVIIPIRNQIANLDKILYGITHQTLLPTNVIIIIDRPSESIDDYMNIINKFDDASPINFHIRVMSKVPPGIANRKGEDVFLAPYNRNVGIDIASGIETETYIFIDGDCIPQEDLVKSHHEMCSLGIPMLSVGRRRESKFGWKDQREVDRVISRLNLFGRNGTMINNLSMLKQSVIVWSCNIALNRAAINRLIKFNSKYYGTTEVFSSMFNGTWGGEDAFLGVEAYYSGITIHTMDATQSGVKHIDHPRPANKYGPEEHMRYFQVKIAELGDKMIKSPLSIHNLLDGIL